MTNELATYEQSTPTLLAPVVEPAEMLKFHDKVAAFVQASLVQGIDTMDLPGTDNTILTKAGAERLRMGFGLRTEFEIVESQVDHAFQTEYEITKWKTVKPEPSRPEKDRLKAAGLGRSKKFGDEWVWQIKETETGTAIGLYRYVVKCRLYRGAQMVSEGLGLCSSLESKYMRTPRDAENTILKMAEKRAAVGATLTALSLSNRFTQDIDERAEEFPDYGHNQEQAESEASYQKPAPTPPPAPKETPAVAFIRELGWNKTQNKSQMDQFKAYAKTIGLGFMDVLAEAWNEGCTTGDEVMAYAQEAARRATAEEPNPFEEAAAQ